ncbi:YqaA family protein [Thiohalobacter sp. IOR34]|uniref:YqaA family protein n=1 Tax=Thiohalobacter sp. IOR34 TaxID=3057176 RepID=UPI0025B1A6D2|nr:YqaA family protein [Thiohalobacter sp. IOR34]WJW76608.1 YqaA family protein [Thiohalobacter sp. IOR34]
MGLFNGLYERTMRWSRSPRAPWYLAALSFAESSFFPIPPDVMLAPMSLARPARALGLAGLTTLASVLGGFLGYAIGYFAFEAVEPLIRDLGYWEKYATARAWFDTWGFWAVLLAGFSPIPYKVFTIAAGSLSMALLPFAAASLVGRGTRFLLVALLMAWGGPRLERVLRDYIEGIGWLLVVAAGVAYLVLRS